MLMTSLCQQRATDLRQTTNILTVVQVPLFLLTIVVLFWSTIRPQRAHLVEICERDAAALQKVLTQRDMW